MVEDKINYIYANFIFFYIFIFILIFNSFVIH